MTEGGQGPPFAHRLLFLSGKLFVGEHVDLAHVHANQLVERMPIIDRSGAVGVDDDTGGWISQKHHRTVFLEESAEALLALGQRLCCLLSIGQIETMDEKAVAQVDQSPCDFSLRTVLADDHRLHGFNAL